MEHAFSVPMGAPLTGLLEVDAEQTPVARRALVATHSKGTVAPATG